MSGSEPVGLDIPESLFQQIFQQARAAFPAECCGWLSGPRDGTAVNALRPCDNAQPAGDHPTAADRDAETAYVIAGADLLAFTRALDSETPARIIYHSHPNGRAYFSETDRQVATSPWGDGPTYPVQQLVVGLTAETIVESALFAWSERENGFVELRRYRH